MNLVSYGHNNNKFRFCRSCFYHIQELNIPKFGTSNAVNVCPCQDYSNVFNNFIILEKVVIACAYLIILILKLKPSNLSFLISY